VRDLEDGARVPDQPDEDHQGLMRFELAQVNVGRLAAPIDSEQLRPFVERLAEVNGLADSAPGFVWRLQTAEGDATAVPVFDDPAMIVNLTVWESIEAVRDFAGGVHVQALLPAPR
jgi:hypothetical protein